MLHNNLLKIVCLITSIVLLVLTLSSCDQKGSPIPDQDAESKTGTESIRSASKFAEPTVSWVKSSAMPDLFIQLKMSETSGALPFLQRSPEDGKKYPSYDQFTALLYGILYSWGASHPAISSIGGPVPEEQQKEILVRLGQGFRFDSMEDTILDVAYVFRKEFGSVESLRVLENGTIIRPQSSKIRSDLILDAAILSSNTDQKTELADLIVENFDLIDLRDLDDIPRQAMILSAISAKIALEVPREEVIQFFERYDGEISDEQFRATWIKLLEVDPNDQNPFGWVDMHL